MTEEKNSASCDDAGCGTIKVDNKTLKRGYTTGTCAAAATKMASDLLLSGMAPGFADIETPKGIIVRLRPVEIGMIEGSAFCSVRKDGGDDIDATHGMLIRSTVTIRRDGVIAVDGGVGVGRVTRKGLDQPPGNAAINHVPREMIAEAVRQVCDANGHTGGMDVIISAPEGEAVAKSTFNSHLGIVGGISIIGTSGIVEPMSQKALVDTIRVDINVHIAAGEKVILVVPGNYGKEYTGRIDGLDPDAAVKCSNFIGDALDISKEGGLKGFLLIGNIGKLVKLAGGIMNTHSRNGDGRMEILTTNFIRAGGDADTARSIADAVTTDDAWDYIVSKNLEKDVADLMMDRIKAAMEHRTDGALEVGAMMFSSKYGFLGMTEGAEKLLESLGGRML